MVPSLVMESPTYFSPLMETMRSPASSPTFSEGPPLMTFTTRMVSRKMVNCTPMPEKLPFRSCMDCSTSEAEM